MTPHHALLIFCLAVATALSLTGCEAVRITATNAYTSLFPGRGPQLDVLNVAGEVNPLTPKVGDVVTVRFSGLSPEYRYSCYLYKGDGFGGDLDRSPDMGPVIKLGALEVKDTLGEVRFVLTSPMGNDQDGTPFTVAAGDTLRVAWQAYKRSDEPPTFFHSGGLDANQTLTVQ